MWVAPNSCSRPCIQALIDEDVAAAGFNDLITAARNPKTLVDAVRTAELDRSPHQTELAALEDLLIALVELDRFVSQAPRSMATMVLDTYRPELQRLRMPLQLFASTLATATDGKVLLELARLAHLYELLNLDFSAGRPLETVERSEELSADSRQDRTQSVRHPSRGASTPARSASRHGTSRRKRIAVVGSGIAGLSSAWLLSEKHDVVLFESEPRLGGHANTLSVPGSSGSVPVDTGFIVYNEGNYPNFTALMEHLGVSSLPSDMSLSVSLDDGAFEYSSYGLGGIFAQKRNLLSPRFWRLLGDINRFFRTAPTDLATLERDGTTLANYLDIKGYGQAFRDDHLLPQAAAIWSTPLDQIGAYPAASLIRFFLNHGMMSIAGRGLWRTVEGGSRNYVTKLAEAFRGEVRKGVRVAGMPQQTIHRYQPCKPGDDGSSSPSGRRNALRDLGSFERRARATLRAGANECGFEQRSEKLNLVVIEQRPTS